MYFVELNLTWLGLLILYGVVFNEVAGGEHTNTIPTVVPVSRLLEARQVSIRPTFITGYPSWVNLTLIGIGQKFMRDHFLEFIWGLALGAGILVNKDVVRVLLDPGNVSDPLTGMQRYLSNGLYVKYWSVIDMARDQENLFETVNLIHAIHAKVDYNTFQKRAYYRKPIIPEPAPGQNPYNINLKVWDAFESDVQASRLSVQPYKSSLSLQKFKLSNESTQHHPMNQYSFVSFHFNFVHPHIVAPHKILIHGATEEDFMGFLHLWAFIGHAVGLEDKYNICLQPDLQTAKRYLSDVFKMYVLPSLPVLDYEYKVMVESTFKAVMAVYPIPLLEVGVVLLNACEVLLEIECPQLARSLSPEARFYNRLLNPFGHVAFHSKSFGSMANFIGNGIFQTAALRNYNFNTLIYNNFTNGIIKLSEKSLARP